MTHLVPVLRPVLGSPFRRSDLYRIAGAMPSLHLSPRETGSWTDLISGQDLTTFSRANTSPTYELDGAGGLVGFASGQRAIGYSPETGVRGGSIFGQRTQALASPEDFTAAAWAKFGSTLPTVTANTSIAPNGTLTADSVTFPSSSGMYAQGVGGASANTTYVWSIWIKAASAQSISLVINTNLGDPVFLTVNVTTQWQRFSLSKTTSAGTTFLNAQLSAAVGGNAVDLWGANLTAGSVLYPYIGGQVTVPADVLSIDGTNFSQWYNQNGGTLLVSASRQVVASGEFVRAVTLHGSDDTNRIECPWMVENEVNLFANANNVLQTQLQQAGFAGIRKRTTATRIKANTYALSTNGSTLSVSSTALVPNVSTIRIGAGVSGTLPLNGHIHDILYWPPGSPAENRLQQLSPALP